MSPVHANKKGVRYRYYVSRQLQDGSGDSKGLGQRIPAVALEGLIIRRIRQQLNDPPFILGVFEDSNLDAATQRQLIERARTLVGGDDGLPADSARQFVRSVLTRVQIYADRIDLTFSQNRLAVWFDGSVGADEPTGATTSDSEPRTITLSVAARLKRAGIEMKIIVDDGSDPAIPDTSLVRLLVRAHAIRERLVADRSLTLEEIAKAESIVPSYATRMFRLTLLAPDIVNAIMSGRQPPELTARRLMDNTRLPLGWQDQRQQLGINTMR